MINERVCEEATGLDWSGVMGRAAVAYDARRPRGPALNVMRSAQTYSCISLCDSRSSHQAFGRLDPTVACALHDVVVLADKGRACPECLLIAAVVPQVAGRSGR